MWYVSTCVAISLSFFRNQHLYSYRLRVKIIKNQFYLLVQVMTDVITAQINLFNNMVAFEGIDQIFSSLFTNFIIMKQYMAKALVFSKMRQDSQLHHCQHCYHLNLSSEVVY